MVVNHVATLSLADNHSQANRHRDYTWNQPLSWFHTKYSYI